MNFIDCPGADDFVGGVITALNVTDMALMLIDAASGVEVGTVNQFRYADTLKKPVVLLVNQMDHEKADYDNTLASLRDVYGSKITPVQYPIGSGATFNGIIDVLKQKYYHWEPGDTAPQVLEIPESEKERAAEYYQVLLEAAAENDEGLMEKFFDQGTLSEEEMREGIHKGMLNQSLYPLFCSSGEKNMAVHRIMNFLSMVAPSPDDMPSPLNSEGVEVHPADSEPASLYFFKTTVEPHIGEVSYFKVMSGVVKRVTILQILIASLKRDLHNYIQLPGKCATELLNFMQVVLVLRLNLKKFVQVIPLTQRVLTTCLILLNILNHDIAELLRL